MRRCSVLAVLVVIAVLFTCCKDSTEPTTGPATGTLKVTISTVGADLDSDGYYCNVDNSSRLIGANETVTWSGIETGDHTVELTGLADNCVMSGDNPRRVTVMAGETTSATFDVSCSALTGALQVMTATVGNTLDPDGYSVVIDQMFSETIEVNDTISFAELDLGEHTVRLDGVAVNCAVSTQNPQVVSVSHGEVAEASFEVECATTQDVVTFYKTHHWGEIGILLDGNVDGNAVNDATYITTQAGEVRPGSVTSADHNEIISFQRARPVELNEAVNWTGTADTVRVYFANEMTARVDVWMVAGPFDDLRRNLFRDQAMFNGHILYKEGMGLQFGVWSVHDRTASTYSAFLDFACSQAEALRDQVGHNPARLNVYYFDRIDTGSGWCSSCGQWCGTNTIAMGKNSAVGLLAHLIGHSMNLTDVDAMTEHFDETNLMHASSGSRSYLTEGQIFRAHLDPMSIINATYGLRPGRPIRNCTPTALSATAACPKLQHRIWPDGSFPPNGTGRVNLTGSTGSAAPLSSHATTPSDDLLLAYLTQDCMTGEDGPGRLGRAVVSRGSAVVPALLRALEEGPSLGLLTETERAARTVHAEIRETVAKGQMQMVDGRGMPGAPQLLDEELYVRLQIRSLVRRYQEHALYALLAIGGSEALAGLRQVAERWSGHDDLRPAVLEVIEQLTSGGS